MVLLDLIGAPNNGFFGLYADTHAKYMQLVSIERSLGKLGKLYGGRYLFQRRLVEQTQIEDDHVPFIARDVPVIHLISVPFPEQWHKKGDDYSHLSWPTIKNFNMVLRAFVYNYLQ